MSEGTDELRSPERLGGLLGFEGRSDGVPSQCLVVGDGERLADRIVRVRDLLFRCKVF